MTLSTSTRADIETFLFEEAHLLDSGHYKEWLALYDADCFYWMPVSPKEVERGRGVALQNADKQFLEISVNRLYVATAHSMLPMRRECRFVSNVVVLGRDDQRADPGIIVVRSKLVVHEYRVRDVGGDDARTLAATVHHGLRNAGERMTIAWKRVDLINSEASLSAMPVPL